MSENVILCTEKKGKNIELLLWDLQDKLLCWVYTKETSDKGADCIRKLNPRLERIYGFPRSMRLLSKCNAIFKAVGKAAY